MDQTQEVKKEIKKVDIMMMENRGLKCERTEKRKSTFGPSLSTSVSFVLRQAWDVDANNSSEV